MRSIYYTGPAGKYGWVSGLDFDRTDRTKVVRVHLTTDHLRAHRFGGSDEDTALIGHVLQHIREHGGASGSCTVFQEVES